MLTRDGQWYQRLLDDLYGYIEGLDVAGYRWDSTDAWRRARAPQIGGAPLHHLEVWIDLGAPSRSGSIVEHAARAVYACRYQADDDALSQGIAQGSIYNLFEALTVWTREDGCRTQPLRADLAAYPGGWIVIEFAFNLRYQWRA